VTTLDLKTLTGAGCTLAAGGWARQRARIERLRGHVERVEERGDMLRIAFDPAVDRALVDEFVATEGVCCGFLSLGYDESERALEIRSGDGQGWDVVRGFGVVFAGTAS
jgi:hypothetical protein